MIRLVMRPTDEPVRKHEGVYSVDMDGRPLGLRIRAKNAAEAELRLRIVFSHQLEGKYLEFDPTPFTDQALTPQAES